MEPASISARPLALLGEHLDLPRLELDRLLQRHRICDDDLGDGDGTIALSGFVGAMEEICQAAGDPMLAWDFGEGYVLQALGELGLALSLAPTLGDALRCFERGFFTVQTGTSTKLVIEEDVATFQYLILDQDIWPRQRDAELTLGLVAQIIRRYCGGDWVPYTFHFEHEAGSTRGALGARVRRLPDFGGTMNSLSIPVSLLDRRLPDQPSTDFMQIVRQLDRRVLELRQSQRLRTRVKLAVLEHLGSGTMDQTLVAQSLGMSRRTLRRRLSDEELTFQGLVDDCRKSFAHAHLTRTDMPLSEIAFKLGYSDQTAFSRAFTRWFDKSPRAVRQSAGKRTS